MVWLLRLVLLFFILFIIYLAIRFLFRPNRKIESARRHKQFLLLDNEEVIKNFQLTYNGSMFTGEKYLGTTKKAIDVVSISLWLQHSSSLKGMAREDFYFIEKKILEKYPDAEISWKSPIQEFLQQKK